MENTRHIKGHTTETANDTTRWFERDLDDFLKEIHRDNDDIDN
jgi:hypothetical protein